VTGPQHRPILLIDAVESEDRFGHVDGYAFILGHGRLRSWLFTAQFWHAMPRGRSLIAPPLSIASCLLCLPCRGHGSLRGRKAPPQHLVRSAAAAMSTAGSHDASRGPRPSVAADCTLAPSGNRHIRKVVRMNSRCWSYQVLATGCSDQRNGSPERHMLCKITESFRASATRALPAPDRLAIA
jgi:hypothetical protein